MQVQVAVTRAARVGPGDGYRIRRAHFGEVLDGVAGYRGSDLAVTLAGVAVRAMREVSSRRARRAGR